MPPVLDSRGRPKRIRVKLGFRRQKPSGELMLCSTFLLLNTGSWLIRPVRASSEDAAGYPAPAMVYRKIVESRGIDIDVLDRLFPKGQRADVKNRGETTKEIWKCRLRLAIAEDDQPFWAYGPEPCVLEYNRDGYIRHLLQWHLGTRRPVKGENRLQMVGK